MIFISRSLWRKFYELEHVEKMQIRIVLPSGEHASRPCLYQQDRLAYLLVPVLSEPPPNVFLHHDTAGSQPIRPQLLQVGHLTRAEEDFRLSELIFVLILQGLISFSPFQSHSVIFLTRFFSCSTKLHKFHCHIFSNTTVLYSAFLTMLSSTKCTLKTQIKYLAACVPVSTIYENWTCQLKFSTKAFALK